MLTRELRAFHGSATIKELFLKETHDWLQEQAVPRSAYEIAAEICSTTRSFNPNEAVTLENYQAYPSKLGLPTWVASVVGVLYHYNSQEDFRSGTGFEQPFYIPFLTACKVGVDYTPMYHQWEAFILTDYLPESQKQNPLIKKVIDLHEQSLAGAEVPMEAWIQASEEIGNAMTEEDRSKRDGYRIRWDSMRAAFLSTVGYIEMEDEIMTAIEAIIYVHRHEALLTGSNTKASAKANEKAMWRDIMNSLLKMLQDWK